VAIHQDLGQQSLEAHQGVRRWPRPASPDLTMWHLAILVFAAFGWQLFPDGPLANYVITGLLVAYLCSRLAWGSPLWPAYGYGALMALLTAGCGGLYASKADGYHFLCDAGTSLPVSLISGVLAILAAVFMMTRKR
jgi:hypothetical protein